MATALNPDRQISQYGHSAWRAQDGLFGPVTSMAQTPDGYLWIGSESGLIRFDGVRFVPWLPPSGTELPESRITALLTARDGSLWIGTRNGIARLHGEVLTTFDLRGQIEAMVQADDGRLWIARAHLSGGDLGAPVCGLASVRFECYRDTGMPFKWATAVERAGDDDFWVGSSAGLCRWGPGHGATCSLPESMAGDNMGVTDLIRAGDRLLIGVAHAGAGGGLQEFADGSWKPVAASGVDTQDLDVSTMLADRDGAIWVGTYSHGLYRFHAGSADHFGSADGLSSDTIASLHEDAEGTIWAGTTKGVDAFRELPVTTFSKREGLTADGVSAVLAGKDGTVWISNLGALEALRGHTLSSIGTNAGLPGRGVTSLLQDHAGQLWVGTDDRLSILEGGKFTAVTRQDGSPVGTVWRLAEDIDGDLWMIVAGGKTRLLRIRNRAVEHVFDVDEPHNLVADPGGGIWLGYGRGRLAHTVGDSIEDIPDASGPKFSHMLADAAGSFWASSSAGLVRRKDGTQRQLDTANGLPCNHIYSVIADLRHSLWIESECGIIVVTASELDRWWNDPQAIINYRLFDALDGAMPHSAQFQPPATRSQDGRLWFASGVVLQMIDPARVEKLRAPPPVRIENVVADLEEFRPDKGVRLPPLSRDIRIDYTALSFIAPQKIRFRYRLEGYDEAWTNAGTRRQAFYTNLGPGSYSFHVRASSIDGVWSDSDATLLFTIPPVFYQTTGFLALCVLAVLGVGYLGYRARMRQVARRIEDRLAARASERERIARDLHDTLLQTIQGSKLAADTALETSADPALLRKELLRVSDWLGNAVVEARSSLGHLRGMDPAGESLDEALRRMADEYAIARGLLLDFSSTGHAENIQAVVRDEIYGIGCEAIRNAADHSRGTRLAVAIVHGSDLVIAVRDDGKGIDPLVAASGKEGHFGIRGMRERAGRIGAKLSIASSPGGTEVVLMVPGAILAWSPEPESRVLSRLRSFFGIADRNPPLPL